MPDENHKNLSLERLGMTEAFTGWQKAGVHDRL
jgi:hypothetical protein